ncbi:hypothetical protein K435DRAFT_687182, partial [Dendrothele bispora CBS 962.96]
MSGFRKWTDASREERRRAKAAFRIPKNVKQTLLPPSSGSLWDMLKFKSPLITSSRTSTALDLSNFFTASEPTDIDNEALSQLRKLPLPSPRTVHQLESASREKWLNGLCSVVYAHSSGPKTCYPLWIISFWSLTVTHFTSIVKPWTQVLDWINDCWKRESLAREAELTHAMLKSVPWGEEKAGFSDTRPIHTLWRLLGKNWFSSSIVDIVLEVLQADI